MHVWVVVEIPRGEVGMGAGGKVPRRSYGQGTQLWEAFAHLFVTAIFGVCEELRFVG